MSCVGGMTAALALMLTTQAGVATEPVELVAEQPEYVKVEATAYFNKYNAKCSSGVYPTSNHTLAGKKEWVGETVELYDSTYNYIGEYKFEDIGYGKPTGVGKSKLLKGKTLGDIEVGSTIDIYFDTYSECMSWGRQDVYLVWKKEEN